MSGRQISFGVLGVVLGGVGGAVVMMGLHLASGLLYPLPEGVDPMSADTLQQQRFKDWMALQPAGMWLTVVAAHGLGCMAGAAVATLVSGRRSLVPAIIVGAFFTLGGVVNMMQLPHPGWFPFVDLPVYMVLALTAGLALRRTTED